MNQKNEKQKTKNEPLISILIVAYNPGEYLRNTLRSCIEQSYKNTEILILDNASTEELGIEEDFETENIDGVKVLQTKNEKQKTTIRLLRSEKNLGPYNGLNLLLSEAQGDYIAIQDHDDIWHPEKLEKQVNFLENNTQYIGCGTKTIMYYEGDKKYFEYILGEKNYYTIHPSLIFRSTKNEWRKTNHEFRYDTTETEYMCDAWSLKNNLCHGEKLIYNIDESLTLHLIKKGSTNYSYKWHRLNRVNIRQAYKLHSFAYATLTIGWEIMRKVCYPLLQATGLGRWIDPIERIPFRIFGNQIKTTHGNDWWKKYID